MRVSQGIMITLCLCLLCLDVFAALDPEKKTVLITGSNRGIGLEYVRQFSERDWNIIATVRKPEAADDLNVLAAADENIVIEQLDVTDHARIEELAEKYKNQPIDILLSNAGITPRYRSAMAKVKGVDFDMALKSMEVNAIAPLKLAQQFLPHVIASEDKQIVVISSKAGSFVESPPMPMMYSYRGSKAALNMYFYALSFETKRKGVTAVLLSPGSVQTDDTIIPGMERIPPEESVSKMLAVIDGLTLENNGQFLDYEDGRVIPW